MKKLLLTIIFLTVNIFATGSFLSIPTSARELSLGGSFAAVDREIDAVGFNPAGLSKYDGFGFAGMYNKALFGNTFGKATIVHPAGFGLIGINFSFMTIPFETTYEFGVESSSKNLTDINLGVAFQRDIGENFSVGIGAKFISMDLGIKQSATAAGDIGLLYMINPKKLNQRFNIGLAVRNIGLSIKFDTESEQLPMVISSGIMYRPIQIISIFGELDKPMDMGIEYAGGLELNFNIISLRGGYRGGNGKSSITGGMNFLVELGSTKLSLDYGMEMGIDMIHVVEVKMQRPAFFEFSGKTRGIPYDGKNPTKIAVSDFSVKDVKEKGGKTIANWLRNDLTKSDKLTVIARENMEKILKEQELQMTGITSDRDASAIGEILNVNYFIMGTVSKVGSEYYINVKVVNVSTGKIEATAEEVAGSKATLRLAVKKLAMKLIPESKK